MRYAGTTTLTTINPGLFARLMQLPAPARADLLEFIGATVVADPQLSAMIAEFDSRMRAGIADRRVPQKWETF
jgi:hypothetical protein